MKINSGILLVFVCFVAALFVPMTATCENQAFLSGMQFWTQNSAGIAGGSEDGDGFGAVVASGDFNGDTYEDLVVGVPDEDYPGTTTDAGGINIIYGSETGLTSLDNLFISENDPGIYGGAEAFDKFGYALAVGDFDGDGDDDLAIGVPYEDYPGSMVDGGVVYILYGDETGLSGEGSDFIYQGLSGIYGGSEENDRFGFSLAAGDFNGDGKDDLVIGVPYEDYPGSTVDGGVLYVLYGEEDGIDGEDSDFISQETAGIDGSTEAGDRFGYVLTVGDFDGNEYDDLAVGTPYKAYPNASTDEAGVVYVLYGSDEGISGSRSDLFSQGDSDIFGSPEPYDRFGAALAAGDFDGDDKDDLAIGVPYEDYPGSTSNAGVVTVLYGDDGGLSAGGSLFLSQDNPDIYGGAESGDRYGTSLIAGDFDGDGRHDLVVGIPFENYPGALADAGAANVFYGTEDGLSVIGGSFLSQDSFHIFGSSEEDVQYGSAFAVGDYNGDSFTDLAVGVARQAVGSNDDAGGVNVLYGYGIEYPSGWWRGNTHTHSSESDGASLPEAVAAHYKQMGYDFLILSDHNKLTNFDQYSEDDFLCINGEEITGGNHTNGLGLTSPIAPGTIEHNIDEIFKQDGIHHLNHPTWSGITASALLPIPNLEFIEIYNAHTEDVDPGEDERVWDQLLSSGKLVYGLATDDCHALSIQAGIGWIMVRANALFEENILAAIDAGDFYATTGVILNNYSVTNTGIYVDSRNGDRIEFISQNGTVLYSTDAPSAYYAFEGDESYIRARISNAEGKVAWCQPVFVNE